MSSERISDVRPSDANDATLVRKDFVGRQDVDSFLSQPTPRYVPANIRRQRLGSTSALFAWLGPLLTTGGLAYGLAGGLFAGGRWNMERIAFTIVGIAFALVGAFSGFFAWRYRLRNMRLLRHGILTTGRLENIEPTENYVGGEHLYLARFRVDAEGRLWTAECYVGERIAPRARQYAKVKVPVRILFDPDHPDRILWTDSLITVSEEYELPSRDTDTPSTEPSVVDRFQT